MKYLKLYESNLRTELKELLTLCDEKQQMLFKRMYSHDNLEKNIDKVVDDMEYKKLYHALFQVRNTLSKTQNKYNL